MLVLVSQRKGKNFSFRNIVRYIYIYREREILLDLSKSSDLTHQSERLEATGVCCCLQVANGHEFRTWTKER